MSEEVGGCQAWTWEEPDRRGGRESQTMKPVLSAPEAHQWASMLVDGRRVAARARGVEKG